MAVLQRLVGLAAVLAVSTCSSRAHGPAAAVAPAPIRVVARSLALDPAHPSRTRVGELTFAGGLQLTAPESSSFGGLSGLDVLDDGRFLSQTDEGDLIRGRLVLDAHGRLAGVAQATVSRLVDESGVAYATKTDADAEDITALPDGGYAISFEQRHRVLRYPAGGGPGVRLAISPDMARRDKDLGLEALSYKDGALYEGRRTGRSGAAASHPSPRPPPAPASCPPAPSRATS